MNYAYYPGCSLHATAKDYDMSAKAMCQALGIELHEIPDWTCCGASSAHMTSQLLSVALPVKDLITAQGMGMDTAVCCAACYSRLRVANMTMSSKEDGLVHKVDQVIGTRYRGETRVKHLLQIVMNDYGLDALREQVKQDLGELKIAAYYGCLLVRPSEALDLDDPEDPSIMEQLIEALGAQPVNWSHRIECCGAGLSISRTDVVLKLCHDIYEAAAASGANCFMVACPLCQANLDMRQMQVNKRYKTGFHLPAFYFTQLAGLAMGLEPSALGLDKLLVSPAQLLKSAALA
jgi:heterodisulfide reductase subunit B